MVQLAFDRFYPPNWTPTEKVNGGTTQQNVCSGTTPSADNPNRQSICSNPPPPPPSISRWLIPIHRKNILDDLGNVDWGAVATNLADEDEHDDDEVVDRIEEAIEASVEQSGNGTKLGKKSGKKKKSTSASGKKTTTAAGADAAGATAAPTSSSVEGAVGVESQAKKESDKETQSRPRSSSGKDGVCAHHARMCVTAKQVQSGP